ncbi:TatD family hydrolase [Streptomyces sp. NPDC058953]|uniref:TatD family hydrolase n=1 Tax=Streptomyces sp. NPDC058953 TaxID=3346676 RepID=UPI003695DA8D
MRIFDPHIHMTSRTTDDYEAMYDAGVRALVEPAFWLGQPRTSPATFYDYFDALLGWEPYRAAQYGIAHHCAIALNPKEANDPRCLPVLDELPRYLAKDGVVAVGEIGYDSMTPAEDEALAAQLRLAAEHGLPALVHTPHRDKLTGLRRTVDVVRESDLPPDRVLLDHLNETTVEPALDSGCWLGDTLSPPTNQDEHRIVATPTTYATDRVRLNSAADWGRSDPLKTRRVGEAMLAAGFSAADVDQVLWHNPVAFYGLSGRLQLDVPAPDSAHALHEGNSVLRGGE